MRVVKYRTKLTESQKAVLEKEYKVNCPEVDRKMTSPEKVVSLAEFLLNKTKIGDAVIFRDSGWYIGCTRVDNEDIFIHSLSPSLLIRDVKYIDYEECGWLTKKALVVYI